MAVTTFGVTSTSILDRLPQLDIDASAPITSARGSAMIDSASAEVCAIIEATWGAGTSATIGADATTVAYAAAARCIITLCLPDYYLAAHHGNDPATLDALRAAADDLRTRLRRDPAATIGYVPAPASSLDVQTSTQGLDLDTTDTPRAAPMRSRYGGASYPATSRGMIF
jgi:hypothetical protein